MPKYSHHSSNTSGEHTPTEVLNALLQQQTRGKSGPAARRYIRKRWTVELQINLEETVEMGKIYRDLRVTTQDLSRGGFSFLCRHFLHSGSQVHARVLSLPESAELVGNVVNCHYDGAGKHRVGVKFLAHDS